MGSNPTQIRHFEVPRVRDVEHQGSRRRVAATPRRFTGKPSPLVAGARWWDTLGTLAQLCAAADAVDRHRLSKPSGPARLILFRSAVEQP